MKAHVLDIKNKLWHGWKTVEVYRRQVLANQVLQVLLWILLYTKQKLSNQTCTPRSHQVPVLLMHCALSCSLPQGEWAAVFLKRLWRSGEKNTNNQGKVPESGMMLDCFTLKFVPEIVAQIIIYSITKTSVRTFTIILHCFVITFKCNVKVLEHLDKHNNYYLDFYCIIFWL